MNERFKELAAKANFGHIENDKVAFDPRLAKFAELIVRECAEVAGCNAHASGFSLGVLIKQHVGVGV